MINKKLFIKSEGNKYFKRNINKLNIIDYSDDKLQILISKKINAVKNKDLNILEIGSGDGGRLIYLKKKFPKSNFYGIEPSKLAVNKSNKKNIKIKRGSADKIPFKNSFFDIVVFGFCLYLVDNKDLFVVANEADRVLKDKSWLIIKDFETKNILFKNYKHNKKIKIRKMNYSNMFLWCPYISLSSKEIFSHDKNNRWSDNEDQKISISCLRKNIFI